MKISRLPLRGIRYSSPATTLLIALIATFVARPVDANRPLVQPSIALKDVRAGIPFTYSEVTNKELMGLDFESTKVQKMILTQADDYVEYRRSRPSSALAHSWQATCEATLEKKIESPFCKYEMERLQNARLRPPAVSRTARKSIADHIKTSQFHKLIDAEHQDVVRSIGLIGESSAIIPHAKKIADRGECVPSTVSNAIGYKLEEDFPEPEVVELTKRLYRKASECGSNLSAGQASFRLGLILVWQKQCGEIKQLMTRTESIAEANQFHSRAKYWRYYCADQLGDSEGKQAAKESLLKDHAFSFHNLSVNGASEETFATLLRGDDPHVSLRSVIRPDLNGLLRIAEALIKQDAKELAAEVFDKRVREIEGFEPEVRLYAALLLNRIGFTLPKFKVLSSLFQDVPRMATLSTLKMYFPLSYFELVRSKQDRIDPLLILSLIRQESAFNKNARSIVGARGLMQVMPATARTVASVRTQQLLDPDVNVRIGSKYFAQRLHQYSGDVELTLAAYNAGFSRVNQWVKRYPTDHKMVFLDLIPFRETRDYVSSILRNYYFYVQLYGDGAIEVNAQLAPLEGAKIASIESEAGEVVNGVVPGVRIPKVQSILSANAGDAATTK